MSALLKTRITAVWFGLVAATILSWELGHGLGIVDPRYAGAAIIVVAFVKVRFVLLDFMELRHAPRVMRVIAEVWTLAICAVLVVLLLKPPAPAPATAGPAALATPAPQASESR